VLGIFEELDSKIDSHGNLSGVDGYELFYHDDSFFLMGDTPSTLSTLNL